ncbi:tetratricopeptide repeat protein [uncultured Algimonas sp.]|uniref:tetratricopeptide repeat protein n=1 Tax=uncultured Algimonas sp. TaxID=1547920 RepID=UPI0026255861|nr:tetratricopeptide repeat protein [uncultured Algimonas sp.]
MPRPDTHSETAPPRFRLGRWNVDASRGTLRSGAEVRSLEPKVMDLLIRLAGDPGQVVTREALDAALWPGVIVGEDVLSRTLSKLRKALGDSASDPIFIETIPKRGYRLLVPVRPIEPSEAQAARPRRQRLLLWIGSAALILIAIAGIVRIGGDAPSLPPDAGTPVASDMAEAERLTRRADDLYMNFTRADNEAAISLYERAVAADPAYAPAQAGLANALVQRVVRWSGRPGSGMAADSLTEAMRTGITSTAEARAALDRAVRLGERAVRDSPRDADTHKALGFALSASGRLDDAERAFDAAIAADPEAWEAMVNLGEIRGMRVPGSGLAHYMRAHAAMRRAYSGSPHTIGPWLAPMGVMIGDAHAAQGRPEEAERWYRRVLDDTPFEPEATARLARLRLDTGDAVLARELCRTLADRIGPTPACQSVLKDAGS